MTFYDEMQALIEAYAEAYNRCDAEALTRFYSDDGAIYSPYGPAARGRAAIRAIHAEWLAAGERNKRMVLHDYGCDGNVGFLLTGYFGDVPGEDGALVTESGVSLHAVIRQSDGGWKIQVSSLNSEDPADMQAGSGRSD